MADLYWVLTLPARPSPLHVCACHSFSPLNSEIRWVLLLPLYLQERKLRLREVNYVARDNSGPKDLGLKHEAGLPQVHKHLKYLCIAHKALRTKPCTGSVCWMNVSISTRLEFPIWEPDLHLLFYTVVQMKEGSSLSQHTYIHAYIHHTCICTSYTHTYNLKKKKYACMAYFAPSNCF